jgi:predicted dithiol-disulfide oxidoreductase (DUF899 family)
VSAQEWQAAREALLVKEKEQTRALDALAAERRRLPMVRLSDGYRFTAPDRSTVDLPGPGPDLPQRLCAHLADLGPRCEEACDQRSLAEHRARDGGG